jgi:Domain of unknown function (DUF4386)
VIRRNPLLPPAATCDNRPHESFDRHGLQLRKPTLPRLVRAAPRRLFAHARPLPLHPVLQCSFDHRREENHMNLTRNPGRTAGLLYLLLMAGILRLMYIPKALFVHGDAAATAGNIVAHETLFRVGMVTDLACNVVLIFLTLAFFRLFKDVNRWNAVLVIILGGVIPCVLGFFNVVNDAAALMLARGADFLNVFDKPQRDALAMLFLRLHHQEIVAAEIFWGLWLLPLAALVYRSGFLPRFIGVWLGLNGLAYVTVSLVGLLAPQYESAVFDYAFPALLGELVLMLWLIVKGVRQEALPAPAAG